MRDAAHMEQFERVKTLPCLRDFCARTSVTICIEEPTKSTRRKVEHDPKPFDPSSPLLQSSACDVEPMLALRRSLMDLRTQRRRSFTAETEPVIANAFAQRVGREHASCFRDEEMPTDANGWLRDDPNFQCSSSIRAKVKKRAAFFDRTSISNTACFAAFDALQLRYDDFGDAVRRVLDERVSAGEVDALARYLDPEGLGCVRSVDFIRLFLRLGDEARDEARSRQDAQTAKGLAEKHSRSRARQEAIDRQRLRAVTAPYTAVDTASAWDKLSRAALTKGVACHLAPRRILDRRVTPAELKEQLRRMYGVALTRPEMGVIVDFLDKNGDGIIGGAEFQWGWSDILNTARANVNVDTAESSKRRESILRPPVLMAPEPAKGTTRRLSSSRGTPDHTSSKRRGSNGSLYQAYLKPTFAQAMPSLEDRPSSRDFPLGDRRRRKRS